MALYLLSYDISEKNHDYQSLWDYMDSLGATKILYSEYAVPFSGRSLELATEAYKHIMKGDRLLTCELFNGGGTCAWSNLMITNDEFNAILLKYARKLT